MGSSRLAFCLMLAAAGVLLRLVLADNEFFRLLHVPSHDMSQGLGFFATSMHSLRLTGDLAWWFPGSFTGYPQYYQGLFTPLAPTYGHIVFIAWSHLVAILATLGVAIPEYFQYLAVNYLVLPFLAFAAFAWFCSQFLRHRAAVALALLAYVLSGIGLWNSAWFYFQEAFSVFFLLGAALALLRRPDARHWLVLLAAALVQFASLNYWTVYNLFFVLIVAAAYAATHWNRCVRLAVRTRAIVAGHPRGAALAAVAFVGVAIAWAAVIGAAMREQSGTQYRAVFGLEQALSRIQEMRRYTTELFNPSVQRALERYSLINEIHSARYIGIALLPLIAIGTLAGASRRTRWLLASAVLLLAVCLGSPFLAFAWSAIPFMNRIQHVFYFYTHYWQLAAVLVAAVGLDVLLGYLGARTRRAAPAVFAAGIVLAALAALVPLVPHFRVDEVSLRGNLRAALVLALACALLWLSVRAVSARRRSFAIGGVLLVALVDLSAYFRDGNRADMAFTAGRQGWIGAVPSEAQRAALRAPWGPLDPERGFAAGLDTYMPLRNDFWPQNWFMMPHELHPGAAGSLGQHARASPPFLFYDAPVRIAPREPMPISIAADPADIDRRLRVPDIEPGKEATASTRITQGFSFRWRGLRYNDFALEVVAPRDGWLMVRQLHDPRWRVSVDGADARPVKANHVSMALPLTQGRHELRFEYWPLSRRLYWPAAFLLEAVVAAFLVIALGGARNKKAAS